ncbi:MAG: penicillin-binding transpeptidase domain-containing protein [Eubacterium sp.]
MIVLPSLKNGSTSAFTFLKNKIQNMEITPAQLALDPCTGSCIIMNPNTGELLASVSYPGYDSNRLANNMDSAYYNSLLQDGSLPLYNNATQQTTAPGSTFKMVTASAGLSEGAIDPGTVITDTGIFERLGLKLKCWVYPRNHGSITVSQAIRDSCNYFFAETAYRLSLSGDTYQEEKGLNAIAKYATEFGLADKTNIEIPEGTPKIADEFPIDASIGQSNHSYTTAQLARYVSAIANNGTVYDLTLLNKVTDSNGNIVQSYEPQVHNQITDLSPSTWQNLHSGMEMGIGEHDQFNDLQVSLAGKTGTAQENEKRPNHALFVGYAPTDSPQIAIATRIAYGYGSSNACVFVDQVLKYYFKQNTEEELLNGQATNVGSSSNSFGD